MAEQLRAKETILVTAAAWGTGPFGMQLAKAAGATRQAYGSSGTLCTAVKPKLAPVQVLKWLGS